MGKLNKYQEAITIIQSEILDQYLLDEEKFNQCTKDMKPYFDIIQELIDKETPMKPNGLCCKKCGSYVMENTHRGTTHYRRCRNEVCEQVVDWSDEE